MIKKPKQPKRTAPFPGDDQILEFIEANPGRSGKRDIARAFQLNADQKLTLKKVLRQMEQDGRLQRERGRTFSEPGRLPPVTVLEISGLDTDGELLARPVKWDSEEAPPTIYMAPEKRGRSALGIGERVLARLTAINKTTYEARTIRRISDAPERVLGIYRVVDGEGRLHPTDRKTRHDFIVAKSDAGDAETECLVRAEVLPGRKLGPRSARIIETLHSMEDPRSISLIALHDHGIPTEFPADTVRQADSADAAPLDKRDDLRAIPLVTIDGADARDFDDAVWAEADTDKNNPGGWHLMVAIADVAWYVRPGDALDTEALKRGNSTYFPDRVVPMLPEGLSNGWCSLVPNEDRPCMAAHLWVGADGELRRHKFVRGLMKSHARLTYEQVQEARDDQPDDTTRPLLDSVIAPLYGAYQSLLSAREGRGALELDLPERRVMLGEDGHVDRVETRMRFDSHKLIEEFMICANVAAAETLEKHHQPCMYRAHDEPSRDKLESLRDFLGSVGLTLSRGQRVEPAHLNAILEKAAKTDESRLISQVVLRSQSQAAYSPENVGHFGLALRRYCHFTSPIRRYADLLVHRALIRGLSLGEGALHDNPGDFTQIGEDISALERRSSAAERDAVDRFTAAYLADRVGAEFAGRINGVSRFGLFVTLEECGGDGLIPIRTLPDDYYIHDESLHELRGRRSGLQFRLGQSITVRLMEANPLTGGMILELTSGGVAGAPALSRGRGKGKNKGRNRGHGGHNAGPPSTKGGKGKKTKNGKKIKKTTPKHLKKTQKQDKP